MDAPSHKGVVFFMTKRHMSQGVTAVPVQALKERFTRILDRNPGLAVPWGQQSEQDETDQFYQCLIVLCSRPELHAMYRWWIEQEGYYLAYKLKYHWASIRAICKKAEIAVRANRRTLTFMVPWAQPINRNLVGDKDWAQLAADALSPFATVERAQALVASCYAHVAPPTADTVAGVLAWMDDFQTRLLQQIQASQGPHTL